MQEQCKECGRAHSSAGCRNTNCSIGLRNLLRTQLRIIKKG